MDRDTGRLIGKEIKFEGLSSFDDLGIKLHLTWFISNRGTWRRGDLNLVKNEKEGQLIIIRFEILLLIVP